MTSNLQWNSELEELLSTLNDWIPRRLPLVSNTVLATRRFLELLRDNRQVPTAQDVVDSVYVQDTPHGGWVAFDRNKWLGYHPKVVEILQSPNPRAALHV